MLEFTSKYEMRYKTLNGKVEFHVKYKFMAPLMFYLKYLLHICHYRMNYVHHAFFSYALILHTYQFMVCVQH